MKVLFIILLFILSACQNVADGNTGQPSEDAIPQTTTSSDTSNSFHSSTQQTQSQGLASSSHLKVLFIGNSILYHNAIPQYFQFFSYQEDLQIYVEDVSEPGFKLHNHTTNPNTLSTIQSQKWDYVILQEATYACEIDSLKPNVIPSLKKLSTFISTNHNKTKVFLLSRWVPKFGSTILNGDNYSSMLQRTRNCHQNSIQGTSIKRIRSDRPWDLVHRQGGNTFSLYDENDPNYSNKYGAVLTTAAIYKGLFKKTPSKGYANTTLDENSINIIKAAINTTSVLD